MKILAISDTHNYIPRISEIPKGIDLIIHAGDATSTGQPSQYTNFIDNWSEILHKRKIPTMLYVPGNHDKNFEFFGKPLFDESSIIARTSDIWEYEGIRIACSSTTKEFMGWSFEKRYYERQEEFYGLLRQYPDIVVTHSPPFGIMDFVDNRRKEHCGCPLLRNAILEFTPDLHIFGHIHEGYGREFNNDTYFYNVAYCNERYDPINPVTIIDYEPNATLKEKRDRKYNAKVFNGVFTDSGNKFF